MQIFRGVAFLHEANLVHGSLHSGSIFVTPGGDWKLFGFEQMKSTSDQNSTKGHWPGLSKYAPPELQKNSYMDLTPAQVIEAQCGKTRHSHCRNQQAFIPISVFCLG